MEFTGNEWNSDYQLFGRYVYDADGIIIQVDYRLDSTHLPARYKYFSALEITLLKPNGAKQRNVFGQ